MSHVDVIVIGAGGAGLVAAMVAADEGAKVLQFEKTGRIGGIWAFRGGSTAGAQTKMQFEAGIYEDNAYAFYADCMKDPKAREYCDPEVLMFYCQHAGQAVDWLDSLGAYPLEKRQPEPGLLGENWSMPRAYSPRDDFPKLVLAEHEKRVKRGDIEVLLHNKVIDLLQENGRVLGVKAEGKDGVARNYKAGALVICTGGFGSNMALVREYYSPEAKNITTVTPFHATGDGLTMCEKVGAKIVNIGHPPSMAPELGGIPNPNKPARQIAHVCTDKYPGAIWVDLKGKRVVNENLGSYMTQTRQALENAPEQTLIVILDQKIKDDNDPILADPFELVPTRSWEWFEEKAKEGVLIKKANTIEELGRLAGVDARNLKDTINRWNGCVTAGKDEEFGRQDLVYKIENPPFYAIKIGVMVVFTGCGPAVNVQQQVLDVNGKVIPGLYVAGEVAGFQGFATGFNNIGNIVFGRQAGKMAAWEALCHRF